MGLPRLSFLGGLFDAHAPASITITNPINHNLFTVLRVCGNLNFNQQNEKRNDVFAPQNQQKTSGSLFVFITHAETDFLTTTQIWRMLQFLIQGNELHLRIGQRHQIIFNGDGQR